MKLQPTTVVFLFVLGGAAGLLGDHSHVVTGTCALADRVAVVCGVLAATFGPAVEIVIAAAGQFRYAADSDGLFGVAPWLPMLYFAFGVVAALLGGITALVTAPAERPRLKHRPSRP